MFSSLLLRSSKDKKAKVCRDPIVAQKIKLSIQSIAQVGCGKAVCSYTVESDEDCLVLCVSSLLAHRDTTRQHLTVTSCRVQSSNRLTDETSCQILNLSKLNTKDYPKTLPSLSSSKELHTATLSLYAGAISAEDLLIHLGQVKAGTELEIQLEFLIKFTLSPSTSTVSPLQYTFTNKLPTMHLSYTASLASPLPVDSVLPLHTASSADFKDFRWDHIAGSSVIQVEYECTSNEPHFTSGFSVQLAMGFPSGCCSLGYSLDLGQSCSSRSSSPGSSLGCDGIMMLNNTLTAEQFPDPVRNKPFNPSEFVFVIDCSGSMSGSNIQAATDTLITCVKSLPPGSYFNVIAFGSNFKHLFYTSSEYNKHAVEKAIIFANQMQASLGGTELLDPLRWIFKQQRCGGLPRQVFIVTDGGVNNTQHVLHTVKKNRHQARCHTFGIGPEVCTELVTGIAAVSGGRCVLLQDGERLQTKVMEVLREGLQPYISDSILHWHPPEGYSLLETTPKSLGTIYTGSTHTAFALLKREGSTHSGDTRVCAGSVSIVGQAGDEQVEVNVGQVSLPPLTSTQSQELAAILDKVATWSKLQDLEMTLTSSSRKNSHNESDKTQEPEPKRIKLNGTIHSTLNGKTVDSELSEELIELSLRSGIPCGLTCFRGEGLVQQLLPYKQPSSNHGATVSKKTVAYQNQKRLAQLQRMQSRNQRKRRQETFNPPQPLSVSSIAKSTITAVGSTLKTVASSFGLVFPDQQEIQNGHRIEDHLEYQSKKKSALHWDEAKGKLIYPSFYRQTTEEAVTSDKAKPVYQHSTHQVTNGHRAAVSTDNSSDDEEFSISDTESDSSLDPDWDDLRRPSELRPLIQMQLYSGAWPMVRAFSYAVGVPLEEMRKLLGGNETKPSSSRLVNGTSEDEEDEKSNVWTTALAVACLEEYFPHLKAEWEVVAMKGKLWLQDNLSRETDLNLTEVTKLSKELVSKWL